MFWRISYRWPKLWVPEILPATSEIGPATSDVSNCDNDEINWHHLEMVHQSTQKTSQSQLLRGFDNFGGQIHVSTNGGFHLSTETILPPGCRHPLWHCRWWHQVWANKTSKEIGLKKWGWISLSQFLLGKQKWFHQGILPFFQGILPFFLVIFGLKKLLCYHWNPSFNCKCGRDSTATTNIYSHHLLKGTPMDKDQPAWCSLEFVGMLKGWPFQIPSHSKPPQSEIDGNGTTRNTTWHIKLGIGSPETKECKVDGHQNPHLKTDTCQFCKDRPANMPIRIWIFPPTCQVIPLNYQWNPTSSNVSDAWSTDAPHLVQQMDRPLPLPRKGPTGIPKLWRNQ